MQKNEKTVN